MGIQRLSRAQSCTLSLPLMAHLQSRGHDLSKTLAVCRTPKEYGTPKLSSMLAHVEENTGMMSVCFRR